MATANSTRRKAGSSLSKRPRARKAANPLPSADLATLRQQAEQALARASELNGLVYDHPDNVEGRIAEAQRKAAQEAKEQRIAVIQASDTPEPVPEEGQLGPYMSVEISQALEEIDATLRKVADVVLICRAALLTDEAYSVMEGITSLMDEQVAYALGSVRQEIKKLLA